MFYKEQTPMLPMDESLVVFVVATKGDGDEPDNVLRIMEVSIEPQSSHEFPGKDANHLPGFG